MADWREELPKLRWYWIFIPLALGVLLLIAMILIAIYGENLDG